MFPKVTTLPLGVPVPGMTRALRGFEPHVIHLASPALLGYGGVRAARRMGVPTVAVYQTDVPGFAASYGIGITTQAAWAWFRHLHSLADRTLVPSSATMESLVAHRFPRVHRWARGVDILRFAPSARDEALRRRWSPEPQTDRRIRGAACAGKACRAAASALAANDAVQLVIVGDGVDRQKLQSAMPTAVFTGALYGEELAAAYASMDVFVHTGEHETFCQVVQEALASGLPVIAPDAGGPRDLVATFRTGLLLGVNEFEARLPTAVAHLAEERHRYSVAARRSVLGRSWPVICDELLGHYEAVQSGPTRERGCRVHVAEAIRAGGVTSPGPAPPPAATAPNCVTGSRSRPSPSVAGKRRRTPAAAAPRHQRPSAARSPTQWGCPVATTADCVRLRSPHEPLVIGRAGDRRAWPTSRPSRCRSRRVRSM